MSDAMDRELLNEFIDWRDRVLTTDKDVSPQRFLQERDWGSLERRVEEALEHIGTMISNWDFNGEDRDDLLSSIALVRDTLIANDDWTEDQTIGGDITVRRTNR